MYDLKLTVDFSTLMTTVACVAVVCLAWHSVRKMQVQADLVKAQWERELALKAMANRDDDEDDDDDPEPEDDDGPSPATSAEKEYDCGWRGN